MRKTLLIFTFLCFLLSGAVYGDGIYSYEYKYHLWVTKAYTNTNPYDNVWPSGSGNISIGETKEHVYSYRNVHSIKITTTISAERIGNEVRVVMTIEPYNKIKEIYYAPINYRNYINYTVTGINYAKVNGMEPNSTKLEDNKWILTWYFDSYGGENNGTIVKTPIPLSAIILTLIIIPIIGLRKSKYAVFN
jgi:hypothetical protein